jgi:PilZ domain
MADQDEMMNFFQKVISEKQPVKLYNTYRGFPVSYEANIMAVDQGYVAISVHEYQAVSMALEGKTFIQSELYPEIVRASVVAVDVVKKQAVLTEFEGAGDEIGKRSTTRVHPNEPLEAEIYDGRRRIGGKIADISTHGVGLFTFAAYIYGDLSFEKDKEVYIDFRLPNTDSIVRFQGVVTSVVDQKGTYLHRLGLKIFPSAEVKPLLEAYIATRQEETLRELKLIYTSMCQEKEKQG